jgi:hypothetical protein
MLSAGAGQLRKGAAVTTAHRTRVAWDEENIAYQVTCDACDWTTTGKTFSDVKPAAEAHERASPDRPESAEESPG